jgi:tetratricopeptide (TPR) repeat protein
VWRRLGQPGNSASALSTLAFVAGHQGDVARQARLFEQALAVSRAQGDPRGAADVLSWLGMLRQTLDDLDGATALLEEALSLYRGVDDTSGMAYALLHLGSVSAARRDDARAHALYEQSLTVYRHLGDSHDVAYVLGAMAGLAAECGEFARAGVLCDESVARFRQLGDARGLVVELSVRGRIAALQGDDEHAAAAYAECLSLSHAASRIDVVFTLESLALVVGRQAAQHAAACDLDRAARLFGAVAALRASLAVAAVRTWSIPLTPITRDEHEYAVTPLRAAFGEEFFDRAWLTGRRLTIEQAIAEALDAARAVYGGEATGGFRSACGG